MIDAIPKIKTWNPPSKYTITFSPPGPAKPHTPRPNDRGRNVSRICVCGRWIVKVATEKGSYFEHAQ